ncbi:MAG: glycosyltransferase family 4 protein [Acidobacteriota bacterium]
MKILLVANTLPPVDLSGAGEQVVQLAYGLQEAGHEVEILGRGEGGARGPKVLFPLTILRPALKRIRAFRPDVVQVHESDGGLLALRLPRRRDFLLVALQQVSYQREFQAVAPLRATPGGPVIARPVRAERIFKWLRAPLQYLLGRWTARRCDLVLAPSRRTAGELEADYGVAAAEVVPNATGAPIEGRDLKVPVTVQRTDRFLYVGRLRIRKGVEVLLVALAQLARDGREVGMDIIGDGERLGLLERRAAELGLKEVRFHGRKSAAEIRDALSRACALVVPSTYEGMPLVILEAMECSCPVVATAVSGIPEVVRDGESGWLVPAEDASALAQALLEATPQEVELRGRRGRQLLDEEYRPAHVAETWQNLVDRERGRRNFEPGAA